jgi:Asp-tRNA(Asn)/Glu-tRNA(Gln) amidotransferase C subunit
MSHASGAGAFRDDQVEQGLPRELALESAPDPADGLFRAPRVLAG